MDGWQDGSSIVDGLKDSTRRKQREKKGNKYSVLAVAANVNVTLLVFVADAHSVRYSFKG